MSLLWPWGGLVIIGFCVGALGTLIGAGGGFLLVPILLLMYPHESAKTITAISLAVVWLNATAGSVAYARMRRIDYHRGTIFAVASAPGAVLGALVTRYIPRSVFDPLFGLVLLALSTYIFVRGKAPEGSSRPAHVNVPLGAVLSFGVGFLSSLLGIGGGIIHVPLLVQLLDYPTHIATATSHFILAIMSFVGTVTHIVTGEFTTGWRRTLALGMGVLAGAPVGARLSQRLGGKTILRALALGLMLVGIRLLLRMF
ncbi:protein of unknown function DUF81 [Thermobaculum terrenum ATCC BAA-798]|uniref:Probable membrane transporter protein n=1 Tax=Thermobaculum terrenum (strain ATCC BAA-798 / CCMEE 7001 / YNP1) TaxID=525904 RepID=D1CHN5_THET1|nr:sulfite exporter TauE/SafE family protein [Thermobaculum terrenum]ACZ43256.1 protein of unknown function DUF81 [Thermobaculum terrenum ATCC BAA-798]